jgi:hypothetical protein
MNAGREVVWFSHETSTRMSHLTYNAIQPDSAAPTSAKDALRLAKFG